MLEEYFDKQTVCSNKYEPSGEKTHSSIVSRILVYQSVLIWQYSNISLLLNIGHIVKF